MEVYKTLKNTIFYNKGVHSRLLLPSRVARPASHVLELVVEARRGHHAALRPGEQSVDAGRLLPQLEGRQGPLHNSAQQAHSYIPRGSRALLAAPHAPSRVSHEAAKVPARQPNLHYQYRKLYYIIY